MVPSVEVHILSLTCWLVWGSSKGANVPLLTRINLKLGVEILDAFSKSTIYAPKWAKAWHTFNTAVMSHYISKDQIASQFVIAAVKWRTGSCYSW
ncbi:hypothetical protein Bca52824_070543 [Brassica carinata]|uniref:Uncharacterized protein n=1 Tax=Brassica carinata TaxID=52824 RepID=A0A8X7Q464_BRACI|nr:hypothetical protein Bca52824_070543 [Brassica carinata]